MRPAPNKSPQERTVEQDSLTGLLVGQTFIVLAIATWAGSNVVYKVWSQAFPPFLFFFFRYLVSAVMVGFLWVLNKGYHDDLDRRTVATLVVMGVFGIAYYNLSLFIGLRYAPAAMGAVFISTAPIYAELLLVTTTKIPLSRKTVFWAFFCMAGVAVVVGLGWEDASLVGLAWLLSSAVVLAFYNVFSANMMARKKISPPTVTFFTISSAAGFFFVAMLFEPRGAEVLETTLSLGFWLSILYLSFFGVMIGRTLYNIGVKKAGANIATISMNLSPILTAALAFLFIDEIPTPGLVLGGAIVIIGVVGVVRENMRRVTTRPSAERVDLT